MTNILLRNGPRAINQLRLTSLKGVLGTRNFSSTQSTQNKVTVVGAAGGIGQPLSLLLKTGAVADHIKHLALYDVAPVTPGVAADLSHCDTFPKVTGHAGEAEMGAALKDADLVIVPAGVPRKPGMTRDDLFKTNAGIVAAIAKACAANCPKAFFLVISNPVNSTVPIFAEILKRSKVYNPKKLFGVTTLDIVRANTFVAENQKLDVKKVNVSVVGGHAGQTILPLLSQIKGVSFSQKEIETLTQRIMFGGDEVVKAKGGAGSATLSMAYAGVRFAYQVLRAKSGAKGIIECSFVESNVSKDVQFFSSPVELGADGITKIHGFGKLSSFEEEKYKAMIPELQESIKKGIEFAKSFS